MFITQVPDPLPQLQLHLLGFSCLGIALLLVYNLDRLSPVQNHPSAPVASTKHNK